MSNAIFVIGRILAVLVFIGSGLGHLTDGERKAVAHLEERGLGDAAAGKFTEDFRVDLRRVDRGAAGESQEGKEESGLDHAEGMVSGAVPGGKRKTQCGKLLASPGRKR